MSGRLNDAAVFICLTAFISFGPCFNTRADAEELAIGSLRLSGAEWSVAKASGGIMQLTNGSDGMVLVSQPSVYGNDKMAVFKAFVQAVDPAEDVDEWKIRNAVTPGGYDVLYASEFVEPAGLHTYFVPVAIFSLDKMAMVALADPEYRDELQSSFGNLLASARFVDNPTPQSGPGEGERLDGFYAAIGSKAGVSATAQVTVEVGAVGLWLKPDGRYAHTESGIVGDFDTYCERLPKNCGRYEISNGGYKTWRMATNLETKLQLYRKETEKFAKRGRDIVLDGFHYRYVAPLSDFRLDGDYRLLKAGSQTDAVGRESGGYIETAYGFKKDGRFVKGGSVSMFTADPGVRTHTFGDRKARTGKYRIDGYTLTLTYDDGETEREAFFMMDTTPVIDGDMYEKRQ